MEQFECQYGLPTSHNNGSTKRANISKSFFAVTSFLRNGAEYSKSNYIIIR